MISLTIVVLIVIMAISWNRYRDILCPAVIQNVFWIISLLGLLTLEEKKYVSLETLFIVIIGSLMFQFGFLIRVRLKRKTNKCSLENAVYVPHKIQMLVLTIVCFSLFCIGFFQYYRFISSMGITTWYKAISTANLELNLPVFFDYVKKIIQFISLCYLIIYWCTDKVDRKKIRKIIIIQFFMAVLCVASVPSRNSMLFYLLPLAMLYLFTHAIKTKKVITIFLIAVIAFMLYYAAVSTGKYWYLYSDGTSGFKVLIQELQTYLSGSYLAFSQSIKENSMTLLGDNTFRFFKAVFDRLFDTNYSTSLVQEFVMVGKIQTNVYTFYDYYMRDFGVVYALGVQFVVGVIHGVYYRSVKAKRGGYWIYILALLTYPLVMQFFQDQYVSLLSTWLQIMIVGAILLKTNIFFHRKDCADTHTSALGFQK